MSSIFVLETLQDLNLATQEVQKCPCEGENVFVHVLGTSGFLFGLSLHVWLRISSWNGVQIFQIWL